MAGKGSRPRPFSISQNEFDNRWDLIFKKDKVVQTKTENNQNEVGKCGCGRSPTGKCIGWHGLSESEFQAKLHNYIAEEANKDN